MGKPENLKDYHFYYFFFNQEGRRLLMVLYAVVLRQQAFLRNTIYCTTPIRSKQTWPLSKHMCNVNVSI